VVATSILAASAETVPATQSLTLNAQAGGETVQLSATTVRASVSNSRRDAGMTEESIAEARAKIAYLLQPSPPKTKVAAASFQRMNHVEIKQHAEQDTLIKSPTSVETSTAGNDSKNAVLDNCIQTDNETPATNPERTPSPCLAPESCAQLVSVKERLPAIFGIKASLCSECGSEDVVLDRAFVELGKLYCQRCWGIWERCGWWRPSIRVSTAPPEVSGKSQWPDFGPEDAFCLPAFLCGHDDLSLLERLQSEMPEGRDFSEWHGARHLGIQFEGQGARHDGPSAPVALRETVAKLEAAFGIEASASRLNLYRSNRDYKPFHFDRGRDSTGIPQVTVGASFGATRELTFVHVRSGVTASFPQRNGDVFAFTPELNTVFMHGVPKVGHGSQQRNDAPRLSLILWGARKTVLQSANERIAKSMPSE